MVSVPGRERWTGATIRAIMAVFPEKQISRGDDLSRIWHTATFSPDDSPARIREELVCPACGHHDPGDAHLRITDNSVRIFCSSCGAFVTIMLSDEQARAIRRCSTTLSAIAPDAP